MILFYVHLNCKRFTEFDAHYFPEKDVIFTRFSEPKNYSDLREPANTTVLCVEIPCFYQDRIWSQSNDELLKLVTSNLARIGLPVHCEILQSQALKIKYAYPLYRTGYEMHFNSIDDWLSKQPGLLTFGRQGLYAHDNTHHAIFMALKAAECLNTEGQIDTEKWQSARKIFETHVVED